jgi:hypothetical protein
MREKAIWAHEWKRPQAMMWEANGQELEVALYVRTVREAERPKTATALRTLLVRMQEHLGLSQPGLARNRWLIVDDASFADAAAESPIARPILISDARDRLRQMTDAG